MSSHSYWQLQAGMPMPSTPTEQLDPLEYEVCIIGAGITGASAAWHLAQRGVTAVVVDAREPALAASGRNAGMLLAMTTSQYAQDIEQFGSQRARDLRHLSLANRDRLLALAQTHDVPLEHSGSWILADSPEEKELLQRSAAALEKDGFFVDYRDSCPFGRGFMAGLGDPENVMTQPARLVQALLADSGQLLVPYSPVERLEGIVDGVRVYSQRVTITCRQLLLATNAYSARLYPFFAEKITPCRGQIQVSEPAPIVLQSACSSQFGYYYFRQIPDPSRPGLGRWMMGGARNVNFASENGHTSEAPSADIQAALTAYTARYFPECASLRLEHQWAGTMGFTADHLPLVGQLPDLPQVTYCVGFSGHGMGLAFQSAELAVELMRNGRSPYPLVAA